MLYEQVPSNKISKNNNIFSLFIQFFRLNRKISKHINKMTECPFELFLHTIIYQVANYLCIQQ
jgi:hypothetical protein